MGRGGIYFRPLEKKLTGIAGKKSPKLRGIDLQ
jgi:hypothetical protein